MTREIVLVVGKSTESGYSVRTAGAPIFVEADDLAELHPQVRDAMACHFKADESSQLHNLYLAS